jgi:PAS domain S-box-containing protein
MPQFLLRQKYVFILVCTVLVILSTSIFLIGEKHFNINQGDIQAFVLTDEQLITEHNEEFYRKIINNSEDEFVIVESDVIIKFASSKWEKEMGFKEEDILGKNFFSYVNPQDLPFIANSFIVVLDNKEINENIGPFRLNVATAIPIFNEKDKVILIALVLHDISNPLGGKDEKKELSEFNRQELEKLITMEK